MECSGNDSEDSVELSAEHISAALNSLTNSYLPDRNDAVGINGSDVDKLHSKAYMKIVEQPQSRGFRFRYKCEGPSHGGLQGVNSEKGKKSFPTVQIMNYEGPARILVSLVTDESVPKTHAHELVGKYCSKGICLVDVKEAKNPIYPFQNIGVMHVTKRKVVDVLKERILDSMLLNKRNCSGNINDETIQLNDEEKQKAKEQADTESKNMQLNVVRLCFQAYLQDKHGQLTIMLPSVISKPIYDSKSPGAAALKICRMDKCGGCCTGNEEVFLLCEKVQKDDIKVLFIEMDQNQKIVWQDEANFGPTDVHKQYAIVFKTPEYRNVNIKDPVKVFIKLERPSDEECSEPKLFTYFPKNPDEDDIDKKRRKILPKIPDNDPLFKNFYNPSFSEFTFSEMDNNLFQYPNGGSDNMNYLGHKMHSSQDVLDSGSGNMNFLDHKVLSSEEVHDSGLGNSLSRSLMSKVSLVVTDGNIDDSLEVDSMPYDPERGKPYEPLTFDKTKDLCIKTEKVEDSGISSKIKEKSPDEVTELKEVARRLEGMKILPDKIKTEYSDPDEKHSLVKQTPLSLNLLMAFRNFCTSGNIKDLLMPTRSYMLIPDKCGDNCLHLALINNQSAVVSDLLPVMATCPDGLNISNHRFQTSLHLAVLTNQPDMVELLLKQGVKRNLVDCNGNTAVHLAVKYNYIKCLKSLLKPELGKPSLSDPFPELDMLNCDGFAPLHLACLKGSSESLGLLIQAKAEVNLPDGKSGRTPLHIAVERNDLVIASELLIEAECDTDCITFDGNTPLHIACGRDSDSMVALLLSVGADPEATSGMADWCINDDSDFEYSTDDEEWLDDNKGTKPRDLVYNNEKILRLLKGEPYSDNIPDFDSEGKPYFEGDLCQLSDEMRLNLANLIDLDEGMATWKALAKLLEVEYLIEEADKSTGSPALCILDMYEMLGGQLKDLYSAFLKLEMKDAASLLNQIME